MKRTALLIGFLLLSVNTAFADPANEVERWKWVVVHISDSTHMTKDECNSWHRERGWDSCGYNFVIEPDGTIYEGRGINKVGAHAKGYNSKAIGICFVSTDSATPEQITSYFKLTRQYNLDLLPRYSHHQLNPSKRCGTTVIEQLEHT